MPTDTRPQVLIDASLLDLAELRSQRPALSNAAQIHYEAIVEGINTTDFEGLRDRIIPQAEAADDLPFTAWRELA